MSHSVSDRVNFGDGDFVATAMVESSAQVENIDPLFTEEALLAVAMQRIREVIKLYFSDGYSRPATMGDGCFVEYQGNRYTVYIAYLATSDSAEALVASHQPENRKPRSATHMAISHALNAVSRTIHYREVLRLHGMVEAADSVAIPPMDDPALFIVTQRRVMEGIYSNWPERTATPRRTRGRLAFLMEHPLLTRVRRLVKAIRDLFGSRLADMHLASRRRQLRLLILKLVEAQTEMRRRKG